MSKIEWKPVTETITRERMKKISNRRRIENLVKYVRSTLYDVTKINARETTWELTIEVHTDRVYFSAMSQIRSEAERIGLKPVGGTKVIPDRESDGVVAVFEFLKTGEFVARENNDEQS